MTESRHPAVMTREVVQALDVHADGIYVDATFGRGGHAQAIIARLGPAGRLLLIDRDPEAAAAAQRMFGADARVAIIKGPFSMLRDYVSRYVPGGRVNGVLFDLGVSLPQLADPERGFSFDHDGPLDMRMDSHNGFSARDWLNRAEEKAIAAVIRRYGEERYAARIARAIVAARRRRPLETTGELARLVGRAVPHHRPGRHPATRTFQAIRIYVNRELEELEAALPQAVQVLAPGGRLVVISFHSLEDRIVKRFLRRCAKGDPFPPGVPVRGTALRPTLRGLGRARRPDPVEIRRNPHARSAVLRAAERTEVEIV